MRPCVPFLLLAAAAALPAAAQAPRPDPADARAATAPLLHRSALERYRRLDDAAPAPAWREANDTVARIGGWRAYAREANAPDATPPAAAASAPPRATRPAPPPPMHRH